MPISAIIVDDEQLARDELAFLVKSVADVNVVAQGKNGEQKKDGEKGEQPKPSPDQPDKKLAGDIKPQNGQQPQPLPDAQQQEAEEAQAAAEGKMTEAQAKGLLDSLKGEDTKVHLLKPGERKAGGRVLKDW